MALFSTRFSPLESPNSQLSNGENRYAQRGHNARVMSVKLHWFGLLLVDQRADQPSSSSISETASARQQRWQLLQTAERGRTQEDEPTARVARE